MWQTSGYRVISLLPFNLLYTIHKISDYYDDFIILHNSSFHISSVVYQKEFILSTLSGLDILLSAIWKEHKTSRVSTTMQDKAVYSSDCSRPYGNHWLILLFTGVSYIVRGTNGGEEGADPEHRSCSQTGGG